MKKIILSTIFISSLFLGCDKNYEDSKINGIDILDTITKNQIIDSSQKIIENTPRIDCEGLHFNKNISELITTFYKNNYYKDSLYKYLPFCLDGEYAEKFEDIYEDELRNRPNVFFDYITKNYFKKSEVDFLIVYFSEGIYDRVSNKIEEDNQSEKKVDLKLKIKNEIEQIFNKINMKKINEPFISQLKDSILSINMRY